jgi:hypothetical protein
MEPVGIKIDTGFQLPFDFFGVTSMTDAPRWDKKDTLAILLVIVGISLFHVRGLWPGQAFLPIDRINSYAPWRTGPFDLGHLQNLTVADPIYEYYPYLVHSINEIKRGGWLLWDSQLLLGHPSSGDPAYETFYPVFTLLGLALGPARGLTIGLWLHALMAGLFTYGWLRAQSYARPAAALGAFVYALSGYMVTWFETGFFTTTLSWLPGVLWMFELALRRRQLGFAALAGLMFGLGILAGQVSFMVIFGLFLGLYAVGRSLEFSRPAAFFRWPLVILTLTLGLGSLLGLLQLIPFAEALGQSHRIGGVTFAPLPWKQLMTLLIPNFYGNPATSFAYWGADNYNEATFYAGLVACLLALASFFGNRRFWNLYLGLLGLGLVYFCCGGPGIAWLSRLPVIQYVSLNRAISLLSLIIAFLAASALQPDRLPVRSILIPIGFMGAGAAAIMVLDRANMLSHLNQLQPLLGQAAVILGVAVAILAGRERWPRLRTPLTWSLVGLVFIDLYTWGAHYNPALPIDQLPPATPGIQYLQAHAGRYRVLTEQESGAFIFGPNYLSTYGLSDLSFYSSLLSPQLRKLINAGDPGSQGYFWNIIVYGQPALRLADLLQAGYLVSQNPLADPGVRTEQPLGECVTSGDEIRSAYPVSGRLAVRHYAINRLDLAFRVDQANAPDSVFTVRMWQGASRARLVLESTFTRSQLQDKQPLTFYFAPEADAPGQSYEWEVSTEASKTGVRSCATAGGSPVAGVYGIDWTQVYQGELSIAERTLPLPRAYVVYATEVIADENQAVTRLLDEAFDLHQAAIVSDPLPLAAATAEPESILPANILVYENQRVVIEANLAQPGLLVLGDYFYPGWEVWVDQAPAKMVRANLVWRGVALPPGHHIVEFRYFPRSIQAGLWLSGLGVLGMIGLALFQFRKEIVGVLLRHRE